MFKKGVFSLKSSFKRLFYFQISPYCPPPPTISLIYIATLGKHLYSYMHNASVWAGLPVTPMKARGYATLGEEWWVRLKRTEDK